jgi:hypothetical protein
MKEISKNDLIFSYFTKLLRNKLLQYYLTVNASFECQIITLILKNLIKRDLIYGKKVLLVILMKEVFSNKKT